ncbi:MAG TPA: Hsp20/alpha crystallin family protein [Vicinamibacterales bacterium]|nr:Hsp20/alpha crystallin family protein [Vicinamibacterales bacterium]
MAIERTQPPIKSTLSRYEPGLASNPFSMMRRISDDMERMFDDFWGARRWPSPWRGAKATEAWTPDVEVFERKGDLVVRADLPGLSKDDIKVELTDGALMLRGERKEEKETSEKGYYATERAYGAFYRTIPLPEGVNADQAKASFKDGVLEVTMPAPKLVEKHGRQLEIKST